MTAPDLDDAAPQEILAWALHEYSGRIALACSFGGPTGVVAIDMALAIDPTVPVYYLDTGLLFPQTHALIERVAARYNITPIAVASDLSLDQQRDLYGDALWKRDPDRCCMLRKLDPQRTFLRGFGAWISGIRRDQTPERQATPVVKWDEKFGLVKVSPFARWTESMVWTYIRAHDLPYNVLNDRGYPSVGCTHCTRGVARGEHPRAGRWSTAAKLECGLHG